jgi:Uma2 family endonuclease
MVYGHPKTLLTVQDYAALDEPPSVRHELSNGELLVTPSASHYHNRRRDDFNSRLWAFVKERKLGEVTCETACLPLPPRPARTRSSLYRCRGQV